VHVNVFHFEQRHSRLPDLPYGGPESSVAAQHHDAPLPFIAGLPCGGPERLPRGAPEVGLEVLDE